MTSTAILSLNCVFTGAENRTFRFRGSVVKPSSRFVPSSSLMIKSLPLASRFSPLIVPNRSLKDSALRRFDTLVEWQECKVKKKVEVPVSVAYELYSDRESIPTWMSFISSVKMVKNKPDLSQWTLSYKAFGQNLEYSWLAKNLQPIPNQKIHWISLEGLPNRGTVRFFPLGSSSCEVELTFAYEVPILLTPFAAGLQPLMQGLIKNSLEQFAKIAQKTKTT